MKICSMCKINKPLGLFYRNRSCKGGVSYWCKTCKNKHNSKYVSRHNKKQYLADKLYREEHIKRVTLYRKKREKEDPNFLISNRLRSRLRKALKNGYKAGSAVGDLGCSIQELKEHLEKQFQEGMTWENHGKWHIDHIKPLSSFDLGNRNELLEACHYTNLQPLWAKDNLSKNSRV